MIFFLRHIFALAIAVALLITNFGNTASADATHPLAPPDISSPRATMQTFLDTMNDAVRVYKTGRRDKAKTLVERATQCLNLENEPPALRYVMGFYTALYLKETLDRIEIPTEDNIPDAKVVKKNNISSWSIPYTEITIALAKHESSAHRRRFLFTSDTVRKAETYYDVVRNLPYRPNSGHGALLEQLKRSGSLILSKEFVDELPRWTKIQLYGEAIWQWIGLILYFCLGAAAVTLIYRWGGQALGVPTDTLDSILKQSLKRLILPVTLILFSGFGLWFLVYGLRFLNPDVYGPIAFIFLVIFYGGWIWLIGAILNRLADILVGVGGFAHGGLDDQIIRLGFHLVTVIIIGIMAVDLGARLGLPTYSLITGLGIGGLAVALAGREALSNVIGTIMIILDRPFKLGDYIILEGGERGEVHQVGLRSTRIRTRDDILISIPNSVIANGKMINESAPVSTTRIRIKVGVAYGSDLNKLERTLLDVAANNGSILPEPSPRIRFRGFGDSSLEFELLCWITLPVAKGRTIHELNWAIKEEFEKQGTEIPFPQRDIHIRDETRDDRLKDGS